MMSLSRDQILEADDLATEVVDVPEWGGKVRVRALTGAQRDAFEASVVQVDGTGNRKFNLDNMRARFVALTAVDDDGNRLFTDRDVKKLGSKSAAALERVWTHARKLSGLSDDDVEELVEGFGDDPNGPSTSG